MSLEAQTAEHLAEQRKLRHHNKHVYQLMGGVTLVAIGLWLGAQLFGGDAGFTTNVYTEGLSILVTVLVLNWFADRRATRQRKQELFLQLGSQSNDFALEAKRQLQIEGWLEEALSRKTFPRANWQGIVLRRADLANAQLWEANLINANLSMSNLQGVSLERANLQNANLELARLMYSILWSVNFNGATLQDANLSNVDLSNATLNKVNLIDAKLSQAQLVTAKVLGSNLEHVDLSHADLRHATVLETVLEFANLSGADLANTNLAGTRFNEFTILPDGTHWTPDTDMARFTDPNHPKFWRSDDPESPAYRGA